MKLLTAALALLSLSQAAAVNIPLIPLPFETTSLGGGLYQVYDTPELRVMAYSETPLEIASKPSTPSRVSVDLQALPSTTQQIGPHEYTTTIAGINLTIQTSLPVRLLPPPQVGLIRENRGKTLNVFEGVPDDLTGSLNMTETATEYVLSYSIINLGNRAYSLDASDLSIKDGEIQVSGKLERRNGNLTPGIINPGKGEIGRVRIPKISNGTIKLAWTIRSGPAAYTLQKTFTPKGKE